LLSALLNLLLLVRHGKEKISKRKLEQTPDSKNSQQDVRFVVFGSNFDVESIFRERILNWKMKTIILLLLSFLVTVRLQNKKIKKICSYSQRFYFVKVIVSDALVTKDSRKKSKTALKGRKLISIDSPF